MSHAILQQIFDLCSNIALLNVTRNSSAFFAATLNITLMDYQTSHKILQQIFSFAKHLMNYQKSNAIL